MSQPVLGPDGKMIGPPLLSFVRFIDRGMSCLLKLTIADDQSSTAGRDVQFSLSATQCREIAEQLIICAEVIEWERPTAPQ